MSEDVPEQSDYYALYSAVAWHDAYLESERNAIKSFVVDPVLKFTGNPVPPSIIATSGLVRVFGTTRTDLPSILKRIEPILAEDDLSIPGMIILGGTPPHTKAAIVVSALNDFGLTSMDAREFIDLLSKRGRLQNFLRLAHPRCGPDVKDWLNSHGVDWDYVLMHYDPQAEDSIDFFAGFLLGAACSIATMKIFEAVFKVGSVAVGTGMKWFSGLAASERVAIVAVTGVVITDRVTPAQICEIAATIAKSAIPMVKRMANSWAKEFDAAIYSLEFFKAGYMLGEIVPQLLDLVGLINGILHLASDIVENAVILISKKVRQIEWNNFLKILALDKDTFAKLRLLIDNAEYGELVTVNGATLQKANDELGTIVLATTKEGQILGSTRVPSGLNAVRKITQNLVADTNANLTKSAIGGGVKAATKISLPANIAITKRFERFMAELELLIQVNSRGLSEPWAVLRTRTIDPNAIKAIKEILERIAPEERAKFLSELSLHASESLRNLQRKIGPWNVLVSECGEANTKALVALVGRTPELMSSSAPSRAVIRQAWSQLNEITLDAHHFIEKSMYARFAKHFKRIATKNEWASEETMLAIAIPTQTHQRSIEAAIKRLSQGSIPDQDVMKIAGLWLEEGRVADEAAVKAAGSITNLFDITAPLQRIVRSLDDIPASQVARSLKEVSASKPYLLVDGSLTADALSNAMRPPPGISAVERAKWLKKVANGDSLKFAVDPKSPYGLVDLCDAYSATYNVLWGGGTVNNVTVSGLADELLPALTSIRKTASDVATKMGY